MIESRIEKIIIHSLLNDEKYTRKVLPYIKEEYFSDNVEKLIFRGTKDFIDKYNDLPSKEAVLIYLDNSDLTNEKSFADAKEYLCNLKIDQQDSKWLLEHTEKFCQEKAIYNAIISSVKILDGKEKALGKGEIPKILSEAISVSFDPRIGHDFLEESSERYESYNVVESKIPFDLTYLNKSTDGGAADKTLIVLVAGPNVGKSLTMCHMAAANLSLGKKVLYVTMEMSELRIARRIDANLLNVPVNELRNLSRELYEQKVAKLRAKTDGKLVIKEYPTSTASSAHIRHLLDELKIKKQFTPDVIYVDYLNIMLSSRLKPNGVASMYSYVKAIGEELRGLAVEYGVPLITATQLNKSGAQSSDPDMSQLAESFATNMTADMIFAIITSEEMEKLNQLMFKKLKDRDGDVTKYRKFFVGIDRPHMRLYDLEDNAQTPGESEEEEMDSGPVFDKSTFGENMKAERKSKFSGIKF